MRTVGDLLVEFKEKPPPDQAPPVLTLTERNGFIPQAERFSKRLATEDTSSYKVVRRNDIAFNPYLLWAGAVAQNTIVDAGVISPLYPTFHVREGHDPRYVARLLLTPEMIGAYDTIAFGSVPRRRRSSVTDFLALPLASVPPLAEQRRIAAILDHADALREKRRQVIAHLDALPQAIFHEMFSGLDLPEASGREAMPLIRNGVSPSTKGTVDADVLTLSSVTRGRFDPGAIKRATFDITPGQDKRVSATDFLMCRGNGNLHLVGRGVLPNADRPDLVFPDTVIAGRIDTTVVHPRYLETVWSQRATRDQIEGGARTTNGTHKINQQLIARVKIPIPPLENQREYARRVALVDEQRAVSVSALAQADELFASLQSRAFRGEL